MRWWFIFLPLLLFGCQSKEEPKKAQAEPVVRKSSQQDYALKPAIAKPPPRYPWGQGQFTRITKEHFRCKGSFANPVRTVIDKKGTPNRYFDCGGVDRHSLYLRDGKEFIYPILIDILNYLQTKTGRKVIVTSGYRCPDHNAYVEPASPASRHMIGAAVTFYVQDTDPDKVVSLIMTYYKERYPDKKEFTDFERYTKNDIDVSTPPLHNKEIFIKLYKKGEGRNPDNTHPFSYLSLQVRYDKERDQKVVYTWDDAFHNYLRK